MSVTKHADLLLTQLDDFITLEYKVLHQPEANEKFTMHERILEANKTDSPQYKQAKRAAH